MEEEKAGSVEFIGTKFVLGSFSDMLLTFILGLSFYALLLGTYRTFLHAKRRKYDKKSIVHLIILLPLSLALGNVTKTLFFR
ncbi:hypothetical protein [Pseudomonas lopnurensis]|uniref:hypothetical protein n=1 Tax=Pseudomonas lopnurensis TaxID=1477517 RepID=UPI0028B0CCC2|nr:hypothetical protein [Pseudomonas lopnurensis]